MTAGMQMLKVCIQWEQSAKRTVRQCAVGLHKKRGRILAGTVAQVVLTRTLCLQLPAGSNCARGVKLDRTVARSVIQAATRSVDFI